MRRKSFLISFSGKSLIVNCPEDVFDYLLRVSIPYYGIGNADFAAEAVSTLSIVESSPGGRAIGAGIHPRRIRHHESFATVYDGGDFGYVEVDNPSVRYEWRKNGKHSAFCFEISCGAFTNSVHIEIFRFVRGYLQKEIEGAGFIKAHCAAFTTSGAAICLVGASGAGKTSFLMRALSSWKECAFITNDKAFLMESGEADIALSGAPYAISVCREIADSSPIFASDRKIGDEYYHWPCDLGRKVPFPIRTHGIVGLICQVEFRLHKSLSIINVEGKAERNAILDILLECPDQMTPLWLPSLSGDALVAQHKRCESIRTLSSSLRMVRISGDPWLYELDFEKLQSAIEPVLNTQHST